MSRLTGVAEERKRTWMVRIETTKKKHRSKLQNWAKDKFALDRADDFHALNFRSSQHVTIAMPRKSNMKRDSSTDNTTSNFLQSVDKISCKNLSIQNFVDCYEKPALPVIISNIPQDEDWKAVDNWNFKSLSKYDKRMFKCGEDDKGYAAKIRLKYFMKYLKSNDDDSPLYVFDSHYDDDAVSKGLLEDYKVPRYFPDDLFSLVGEKRRPPYRWFLIGPKRSGTCVHIDPLGTSAWNTVIKGTKRWVIFPPGTPKKIAKALDVISKGEDDEAINYFVDFLPRLRALMEKNKIKVANSSSSSSSASDATGTEENDDDNDDDNNFHMLEFNQYPGDTVFIPGGWWHAVINLEDTIAITQNFCSRTNLARVWRKTRTGRRKMAQKWLRLLSDSHPELASEVRDIDIEDDFVFPESKSSKKKTKKEAIKDDKDSENEDSLNQSNNVKSKKKSGKHRINKNRIQDFSKDHENVNAEINEPLEVANMSIKSKKRKSFMQS